MLGGLLAVSILILLFLIMRYSLKNLDKENEQSKDTDIPDGYLYDEDSGTLVTVEEIENGEVPQGRTARVKSQEEIEAIYDGDEKEIKLVENTLREKAIEILQSEEEDFLNVLEGLSLLALYSEWAVDEDVYKLSEKLIVGLLEVQLGTDRASYSDEQLIFVLRLDGDYGHYVFEQQSSEGWIQSVLSGSKGPKIEGFDTHIIQEVRPDEELSFLQPFKNSKYLALELVRNFLVVKTTRQANLKDFHTIMCNLEKCLDA